MDFNAIINGIVASAQANMPLSLAGAALFILLLYRKPKLAFTLLGIVLVLGAVFYLITDLSSAGSSQKRRMTDPEALRDTLMN